MFNIRTIFYILIIIVFSIFTICTIIFTKRKNSLTTVDISIANCQDIEFFNLLPENNKESYKDTYKHAKPIKVSTKSELIKLNKGYYRYFAHPINQEYQEKTEVINLQSENYYLAVNLQYTPEKLDNLLKVQLINIQDTLKSKYPMQMNNYSLQLGKLYLLGDWFSGYLIAKDGSDDLQVIMHQKNDNIWEIVGIPNITISSAQYPQIPKEVIVGATEALRLD